MELVLESSERKSKRKKSSTAKQVFKPYNQDQIYLNMHENLDMIIKDNHIAKIISTRVDNIDLDCIVEKYKGDDASAYNVNMMAKVWLLGFCYNTYTSRRLELQLHENIVFIWISGGQKQKQMNTLH